MDFSGTYTTGTRPFSNRKGLWIGISTFWLTLSVFRELLSTSLVAWSPSPFCSHISNPSFFLSKSEDCCCQGSCGGQIYHDSKRWDGVFGRVRSISKWLQESNSRNALKVTDLQTMLIDEVEGVLSIATTGATWVLVIEKEVDSHLDGLTNYTNT